MRVALIDRDGTLSSRGGYCHPDDFQLAPFVPEALRILNEHGVACAVLTSQTGVAHGRFTVGELHACFLRMVQEIEEGGAHLDAIYYCPHAAPAEVKEFEKNCEFHKPKPGMLFEAADRFCVGIEDCFMIGDAGYSDMVAGAEAGCPTILVRTGWGESSLTTYRQDWIGVEPSHIEDDLLGAAKWIVGNVPQQRRVPAPDHTPIMQL